MLTRWGRNEHLSRVYGSGDPSSLWMALLLSQVGDSEDGSDLDEPTGGSYARVEMTNDGTVFSEPADGEVVNEIDIVFPTATDSWGTLRYWALCTSSTGGDVLVWGTLASQRVSDGSTLRISQGAMVISLMGTSAPEPDEFSEDEELAE